MLYRAILKLLKSPKYLLIISSCLYRVILFVVKMLKMKWPEKQEQQEQQQKVYEIINSINTDINEGRLLEVEFKAYYIYSLFDKIDKTNESSLYTDNIKEAVEKLKGNMVHKESVVFKSIEDLKLVETYVNKIISSEKKSYWLDYLSIDYLLSKEQKEALSGNPKDTGALIWKFNKTNLISSIIFAIVFLVSAYFIKDNFSVVNNWFILLIYFLIVIRTMSRGLEIIIAFLKDIFDVNKKTTLTPGDRVKLALLSLIEITILFTVIYIPYNSSAIPMSFLESFIFSFGVSTLTDVNLTFEVIVEDNQTILSTFLPMKSLIIMSHVTIALTLIVLSLAQYVGNISSQKKS